jgi:hypothetical protein
MPLQHRIWSWLPLIAGIFSTYGPIAYNYGFALYFLNYSHGFVKRGLVGELILPLGFLTGRDLLAIELTFILSAFAASYFVLRSVIFGSFEDRVLSALLLSAPAMLPHIGYLFAQPDVTLYLIVLAALALWLHLPPPVAACASTPLCCLALLAHEAFILMFYPLFLALMWDQCRRRALPWTIAAVNIAIVLGAFLAILHFGTLKVSPEVILLDAQHHTNVPVQRQVYDVMASNLAEQFALVRRMYSPPVIRRLVLTLLFSVPYFVLLVKLLRRAGRIRGYRAQGFTVLYILFGLPLLLFALGHDTSRWIAASAMDITLFLFFLLYRDSAVRDDLRLWASTTEPFAWLAILLVIGPYEATGIRSAIQLGDLWP